MEKNRDVLSQSEIESIIGALNSGALKLQPEKEPANAGNTLPYDFRRPNKFSKDQIHTLKNIHEIFARLLSSYLTAYLRVPVTVKLESINQDSYDQFIYSLPLPTLITIFSFFDNSGSALLGTDSFFTFPIIDILLGGSGKTVDNVRDLTDIELSVMRKVNEKILSNLCYAWEDISCDVMPKIVNMETNPQFSQLLASNEAVALLTFSINIAGNDSKMNLCLPYITLEPVLTKLSAQSWYTRQAKSDWNVARISRILEKKLQETEVELSALLGKADISVADFLNLEEGDIILLDSRIDKPVNLLIGDKQAYTISLGVVGNKIAGEIDQVLIAEGEE